MKIIFSTDSLSRGGKERQMAILASHLTKHNCEIFFLSKRHNERDSYIQEYQITNSSIVLYKGFCGYKKKLTVINPELVISWDAVSSLYNLLLFRIIGFIFINASIRHGIRMLRFSQYFRSLVCHLSPYIVANSVAGFRANSLTKRRQRYLLYNGIEPKFINILTKQEIDALRMSLIPGYNENPGLVYISVANFVPYKDYTTVLKALAKMKSSFVFYYFILGDGPMRGEIERTINDLDLEKQVLLMGKTEAVEDYLFASDIMIHSSRGEGISNAVLEGMHARLPVIASNVGGIPETVFPGSSLLFPYKEEDALYRCLLKSLELKTSFNPESKEYLDHLKKFSVDTMVSRFEEIIEEVMKK